MYLLRKSIKLTAGFSFCFQVCWFFLVCTKIELDAQKVKALVAASNVYVLHTTVKRWKKLNARNRCPTFWEKKKGKKFFFKVMIIWCLKFYKSDQKGSLATLPSYFPRGIKILQLKVLLCCSKAQRIWKFSYVIQTWESCDKRARMQVE